MTITLPLDCIFSVDVPRKKKKKKIMKEISQADDSLPIFHLIDIMR